MKFIPIISSILLMGSLAADDGVQYIALEVSSLSTKNATLRVVVRGTDGQEAPVGEAVVVDIMAGDGSNKPMATITVRPGDSSGAVAIASKHLDTELERSRIRGLIRIGDTGLYAGEVIPTPAASAVAN